jgi:deoxyinosine 3'endonuclease (endonuclease V)
VLDHDRRGILVKELSTTVCRGLAVPLTNEKGDVLACAMIGHGGRLLLRRTKKLNDSVVMTSNSGGTKNPIYISVGHNISLQECVQICASFSFTRIPEPVRQADLIGRQLLRVKDRSIL